MTQDLVRNFAAPHRQGRTRPGQTRTEDMARMTCTPTSACLLYHAHQAGGRRVVFYLWSPQVASRRQWERLISTEFGMWERQDLGPGEGVNLFFSSSSSSAQILSLTSARPCK
ncbi:hypothetical protein RRG08_064367 [Elysia crispata]|uniref:Uncharacterized protein n=1 Tax=Elysia crispata TaxID=231223 RepID=A0AAE0ZRM4_9GAST|nr:hypothetical protein RRG08_064367 [Elysia crispata]